MVATHPQKPAGANPRTLFDKIWDSHLVVARQSGPSLIYIDRHLLHEGSFHAFRTMRARKLALRNPRQLFGVADHYVPTRGRSIEQAASPEVAAMITQFDANMGWAGIRHFSMGDPRQGIVHVIGPEQGLTLPGATVVCGDSHTSTHGAVGALAFGIGTSEIEHVLATECHVMPRSKTMRITIDGALPPGVTAKDMALAVIAEIGTAGGTGCAIEYAGSAVRALSMEGRFTLCNMTIEAGARTGMVAPDETTFAYLKGRPMSPKGADWDKAVAYWRTLTTDADATFDLEVKLDATKLVPRRLVEMLRISA